MARLLISAKKMLISAGEFVFCISPSEEGCGSLALVVQWRDIPPAAMHVARSLLEVCVLAGHLTRLGRGG